MSEERLVERFVRLCEIPSITGDERAVADAVATELTELGIDFHEDDSAEAARAGAGNLIARIPGREGAAEWVALFAHLDTVPHHEPIRVVDDGGVLRSAGDTILGADNKAAVTVIAELGARLIADPGPVGVELVFTVAEEQGLRGAAALDPAELRSDIGFVFDHATPIGEVITAAPTYKRIRAEFRGIEAHAGIRPEDGRSAIEAATHAVATMDLGRLDPETTANVGVIEGGTAPNVVAGSCRLQAEARAVDPGRAEEVAQRMIDACTWAAGEAGIDVDLLMETYFRGYRIKPSSRPLAIARAALESCGIEPVERTTGGGSDVNALRAAGFDALLLANGTEANHTPDESVAISELVRMLDVCAALVEQAGKAEGLLKLRRGRVVGTDPLEVDVDGERRRAWADESTVGPAEIGDEVVVNTAAIDLRLGSGGFDVVHVNLTRGLSGGETAPGVHVMKLNYSSLQHAVDPAEEGLASPERPLRPVPVLVLPLHGHLAPAAWAAAQAGAGEARIGFVQAGGGGLPGTLSRDVAVLRERGLLADHVTAASSYGGEREAISLIGALHAAAGELGWDAAIVGPGPGILGSETRYGHGGMAALDGAHSALALGLPTLISPRLSAGDARPRHRGLSHHTASVLELLLGGVEVPLPAGLSSMWPEGPVDATAVISSATGGLHRPSEHAVDIEGYAASGLPTRTMGRDIAEDGLFFAAPLAAGAALAHRIT